MTKEYERGFEAGWLAYQAYADERAGRLGAVPYYRFESDEYQESTTAGFFPKSRKKRRRQSGKQKLLTDMASKAWKSYKRKHPKGKRTYIDIRAQVSRSQAYKKKAKRL